MKNHIFLRTISLVSISLMILNSGCKKNYTPEEEKYIKEIDQQRAEKNKYMRDDPNSPFNYKGKVEFHPLKYFPTDPAWVFKSLLYEYQSKDTVTIFGTKGDERKAVRFGYVIIN